MWCRAEDNALGHLRIDDCVNAITQHNNQDVVVKTEVALDDRAIRSLDEERTGGLTFYRRGWHCERSTTMPGVNMMNMP